LISQIRAIKTYMGMNEEEAKKELLKIQEENALKIKEQEDAEENQRRINEIKAKE
jgi:hypothetical protein